MKYKTIKEKIKEICTYHGDEGTSGYCLSNEQFEKIFELFDQQKKELIKRVQYIKK